MYRLVMIVISVILVLIYYLTKTYYLTREGIEDEEEETKY